MKGVIESLRLGIVPSTALEKLTFGRDLEIQKLKEWLADDKNGAAIISGDYGTGKSHLMEYLKEFLYDNGYASSYVELGNELPPNRPKLIYNKIVRSLSFKDQDGQGHFRDLMRRCAALPGRNLQHPYLGFVMEEIVSGRDRDYIWAWIEGDVTYGYRPIPLYDHSTCASLYCNILGGISYACRSIGLKGLVVIIDEGESVEGSWLYGYQKKRGLNFLRGLSLASSNDTRLATEKISWNDELNVYTGRETGLYYSGQMKDVRYIWKLYNGLKLVCGFTPLYNLEQIVQDFKGLEIDLKALSNKTRNEILDAVLQVYLEAYPKFVCKELDDFKKLAVSKSEQNTRMMIKAFVESLDLFRHGIISGVHGLSV
jgi:hypothetical protein